MAQKPLKIAYVGKDPAPASITDGSTHIVMPEDQSKPFVHAEARRILKVMPELYKPVVEKGKTAKLISKVVKGSAPTFAALSKK